MRKFQRSHLERDKLTHNDTWTIYEFYRKLKYTVDEY